VRIPVGLALAFSVLWSVATPALARQLWWSGPSTAGLAERAQRIEPWFSEPLEWRVDELLARGQWSWHEAAEAISWSCCAVEVHPGSGAWLAPPTSMPGWRATASPDALDGAQEGYHRAKARAAPASTGRWWPSSACGSSTPVGCRPRFEEELRRARLAVGRLALDRRAHGARAERARSSALEGGAGA
jgi:hypothetical protein